MEKQTALSDNLPFKTLFFENVKMSFRTGANVIENNTWVFNLVHYLFFVPRMMASL